MARNQRIQNYEASRLTVIAREAQNTSRLATFGEFLCPPAWLETNKAFSAHIQALKALRVTLVILTM